MSNLEYTVSVSDYADRGHGYRVRCFGLPRDDWNALGTTVYEAYHRTRASAKTKAIELMRDWRADCQGCIEELNTPPAQRQP